MCGNYWQKMSVVVAALLVCVSGVRADSFGTGANEFEIDFVTISGASNPTSGIPAGDSFTFTGVSNDYRIGMYEITNDQWGKFVAELGVPVTGEPAMAYNEFPSWEGADVPTHEVSWYEAAQFVNWLNTSTGHHVAYNFTGTQGTSNYTFATWSAAEADNGMNLYRHKDAFYYLPTEDEWVKAAYWNGTALQLYASKDDSPPTAGVDANCGDTGGQPWDVGSGSEELNGTFDMMGNVWEWTESPYSDPSYGVGGHRALRDGPWYYPPTSLTSAQRLQSYTWTEVHYFGFRVASEIPEPCSLGLLSLGGLMLANRRRG